MNKVVILSGPTATGKTAMAINVAKEFQGEIVNFDSLLFYRELNIGTAKPTPEELTAAKHHMVDVCSIAQAMNAADFATMARPIVEDIHRRGKIAILAGGSGFYLQALTAGMWDSPTTPPEISIRSDQLYEAEGITPFRDILEKHDRESFHRLHENDHYRIRRAVEHFWAHAIPFSIAKENFTTSNAPDWQMLHLHLDMPKEDHQKIIRARTRQMLEHGLVNEVQSLLDAGFSGTEKPLQSIGYKETLDWIQGIFKDEAEYEERIVINTRRLAKSQRTWFKKKDKLQFDPRHESETLMAKVREFISRS